MANSVLVSLFFIFAFNVFIPYFALGSIKDYAPLGLNDQNLKFGLGMSFSKLEIFSETGNFFLLSNTNPKFELRYESELRELSRQFLGLYMVVEQFQVENPQYTIENTDPKFRARFYFQPQWYIKSGIFGYGLHTGLKWSTLISEVPTPFDLSGQVGERLNGEIGFHFVWYGQTVSKLPMNVDLTIAHVGTLHQKSELKYSEGLTYQFGLNFDFHKRSYFSNWSIRGFYEFEEVRSSLNPLTSKEVGLSLFKVVQF